VLEPVPGRRAGAPKTEETFGEGKKNKNPAGCQGKKKGMIAGRKERSAARAGRYKGVPSASAEEDKKKDEVREADPRKMPRSIREKVRHDSPSERGKDSSSISRKKLVIRKKRGNGGCQPRTKNERKNITSTMNR